MAVTDGREAGNVAVDVAAESFGLFEKRETCGAELHDSFPVWACLPFV
jgi:hypothetical protein